MAEPEDHKHCIVCGKVTPADKFLCSKECEEVFKQHQDQLKKRKNLSTVFLVVLFVAVIVMLVLSSMAG